MKFPLFTILSVSIICLCTWLAPPVAAQTTRLTDKISFTVNNLSVSDALEALSKVTGTYFSYNSDQIPSSKLVRVDLQNRPMIEVLNAILGQSEFSFRQMGNQVVIFRNKSTDADQVVDNTLSDTEDKEGGAGNAQSRQDNLATNSSNVALRQDTVFIIKQFRDTLRITDTIVRMDTLIEKVTTPVPAKDIFKIDLSKELTPVLKFDVGVSAGFFIPRASYTAAGSYSEKLSQYKDSYSNNSFAGTTGVDLRASYQNWTAGTGIALTLLGQKLDYTYVEQTGGFFKKDTLDPYYTLNNGDTTWYYILDSTYIPVDNKLYNYRINNHFRYLEIPLTIQYNYGYHNLLFFARAGFITGFFLDSDGHQIMTDGNGITEVKSIQARNVIFSYTAGIGAAIPLAPKLTFTGTLSYRNHLNSIYKDFPVETRFSAISLGVGVCYKLY